jgi:four helix bundle protein
MKYSHFEELPVWQRAAVLYNRTLDLVEAFPDQLTPDFRRQLDRAALSISNNIAEGFDRATSAELSAFLGYARGSAAEVRSMVLVVRQRPHDPNCRKRLEEIANLADECVRQLSGWRKQISQSSVQGSRERVKESR